MILVSLYFGEQTDVSSIRLSTALEFRVLPTCRLHWKICHTHFCPHLSDDDKRTCAFAFAFVYVYTYKRMTLEMPVLLSLPATLKDEFSAVAPMSA